MTQAEQAELRAMVKELLRDILPQSSFQAQPVEHEVRIENDADLAAFAAFVLDLAAKSSGEQDIRSGRTRFVLSRSSTRGVKNTGQAANSVPVATVSEASAAPAPALFFERGAVTEKIVMQAASTGTEIVLGPRVVITPLAKEAARKNSVRIERRS